MFSSPGIGKMGSLHQKYSDVSTQKSFFFLDDLHKLHLGSLPIKLQICNVASKPVVGGQLCSCAMYLPLVNG